MKFKRIYIEITNMCNLSCSFCPPIKKKNRKMNEKEFSRIINQIKPYTNHVYLHIKGEPLSHPLLSVFLDICEENNIQVNLTTNGTLIDESMLIKKSAIRQINFSLHSFDDQKDNDNYIENILTFSKIASEKFYISLRIWNLDENRKPTKTGENTLKAIYDYFSIPVDFDELYKNRRITLLKNIFLSLEEEFKWPSLDEPYISENGICYGTRTMVGILSDGTVVPCCLDSDGITNLGNVFEENFSDIIEKTNFKEICNGFKNGKATAPLCKHCSYKLRFNL